MISVKMTETCISFSKAKISSLVERHFRWRNVDCRVVREVYEQHSSCLSGRLSETLDKEVCLLSVIPIAANTTAKGSFLPGPLPVWLSWGRQAGSGEAAGRRRWAASPLTRVFSPSMADMPVSINSCG